MTPEKLATLHALSITVPAPWSAADFTSLLAHPGTFLVAEPQGQAFALGRVIVDEAELLTLVVAPSHRRQGLGHTCLIGFEDMSRQRKAKTAFLEVAESNSAARALYLAFGWFETGKRKSYYKGPKGYEDALILSKRLESSY